VYDESNSKTSFRNQIYAKDGKIRIRGTMEWAVYQAGQFVVEYENDALNWIWSY